MRRRRRGRRRPCPGRRLGGEGVILAVDTIAPVQSVRASTAPVEWMTVVSKSTKTLEDFGAVAGLAGIRDHGRTLGFAPRLPEPLRRVAGR